MVLTNRDIPSKIKKVVGKSQLSISSGNEYYIGFPNYRQPQDMGVLRKEGQYV